jgi:hypothetical protein
LRQRLTEGGAHDQDTAGAQHAPQLVRAGVTIAHVVQDVRQERRVASRIRQR